MICHETIRVRPGDIRVPGLAGLLEDHDVKELAENIRQLGMAHDPMVRGDASGSLVVVHGRRRIAAAVILGLELITVRVAQLTDDQAQHMALSENAYRRHSTRERHAMLLYLRETYLGIAQQDGIRWPEKAADDWIAEQLGLDPQSVRRQARRGKRGPRKIHGHRPPPFNFQAFGMQVPDTWREELAAIHTSAHRGAWNGKEIERCLQDMLSAGPVNGAKVRQLLDRAKKFQKALSELVPLALCPWCKGIEGLQEECPRCLATGWVHSTAGAPPELLDAGDPCVVENGELRLVADITEDDEECPL